VPSGPTAYTPGTPPTIPAPANPPTISAQTAYSSLNGNSYIFIYNAAGTVVPNATPGAYVLITNDPGNAAGNAAAVPPVPTRPAGALTGRLLRLGALTPQSQLPADVAPYVPAAPATYLSFMLQPGSDIKDLSEETDSNSNAGMAQALPVYIMGGAPDYAGNFTSTNQDITAMSAFIRVNTSN